MKHIVLTLTLIFLFFAEGIALPKFATRQGAKCQSCHINPTGKGMRSSFGSTYGREELTLPTFKDGVDFEDYSPSLNDFFSIGMDYRTLFFMRRTNLESSFFQMQGDLYVDLRINKKFRIYYDKGLYSGFEVFGLAKVLPLGGYIKVGKFLPAYGLKLDDHNAFIRGGQFGGGEFVSVFPSGYPYGLRFGERAEDTGIELGFYPSIFSFNVGVFNGTPGGGFNGIPGTKTKAVVARGEMFLRNTIANIIVGGSFYNNPNAAIPGRTQYAGVFGQISLLKNLTLLTEADNVSTFNTTLNKQVTGLMTYSELSYVLTQGVDLRLGFEYYDVDRKLQNGSYSTITASVELFPLTGIEVRPIYRFNREEPKEITNNDEFQLLFHFFL